MHFCCLRNTVFVNNFGNWYLLTVFHIYATLLWNCVQCLVYVMCEAAAILPRNTLDWQGDVCLEILAPSSCQQQAIWFPVIRKAHFHYVVVGYIWREMTRRRAEFVTTAERNYSRCKTCHVIDPRHQATLSDANWWSSPVHTYARTAAPYHTDSLISYANLSYTNMLACKITHTHTRVQTRKGGSDTVGVAKISAAWRGGVHLQVWRHFEAWHIKWVRAWGRGFLSSLLWKSRFIVHFSDAQYV